MTITQWICYISSLGGYLIEAIKKDYLPQKSNKEALLLKEIDKSKQSEDERKNQKAQEVYQNYQNKEILKIYQEYSKNQKIEMEQDFGKYIKGTLWHTIFLEKKLNDPLIQDRFCDFVRLHRQELISDIISFVLIDQELHLIFLLTVS